MPQYLSHHRPPSGRLPVAAFVFVHCAALIPSAPLIATPALAQRVSSIPDAQWLNRYPNKYYYQGLELYRDGDLVTATVALETSLAACAKDERGFWIDAIAVHALLGECFYQAGDLRQALLHSEAALTLWHRHQGWIDALAWPAEDQHATRDPDPRAAWAGPDGASVAALPRSLTMLPRDPRGSGSAAGVPIFAVAAAAQVDAIEVFRGAATAGYRRRLILGPLVDRSLRSATSQPAASSNRAAAPGALAPLPQALRGAVEQCVSFGSGRPQRVADVQTLAFVADTMHPLTPLLLLAAARLAIEQERFSDATAAAWRAAQTGSQLGQPELVAEAMLLAVGCSGGDQAQKYRSGAIAAAAAYVRHGRVATVGALLAASEAALVADEVKTSETFLARARGMLQRGSLTHRRMAAHSDYLAARLAVRTGQSIGGSQSAALDAALERMFAFAHGLPPGPNGSGPNGSGLGGGPRGGSSSPATPRLFQLNLARTTADNRGTDAAVAERVLASVNADPPAWLWKADPVDAIAFYRAERWRTIAVQLELASRRAASPELVIMADALLRHRFLAHLPLGGRVHQVRFIASTAPEQLTGPAAAMRAAPSQELQRLIEQIEAPRGGGKRQAIHGGLLDSLASEIALQPAALPNAMPRPFQNLDLERLPDDHAMLIYIDLGGRLLGLLVHQGAVRTWTVSSGKVARTEVSNLLRGIGVPAVLAGSRIDDSQRWQQDAAQLRRRIIPDERLAELQQVKHLVVVPDGGLWYVPLELLPLSDGPRAAEASGAPSERERSRAQRIGERMTVRYSPTPGLAFEAAQALDAAKAAQAGPVVIVPGTLLSPGDAEQGARWMNQIAEASGHRFVFAADAVGDRMQNPSPAALLLLAGVRAPPADPLSFSPLGAAGADSLHHWLRLPFRAPQQVILPGFDSGATDLPLGSGRELFLTLSALRCAGTKEILVSRWAVGGESTAVLLSELLQETPRDGLLSAWQRSVQLLRAGPLDPRTEPLMTGRDAAREQLSGNHPLFWSGYLLTTPLLPDTKSFNR